MCTQGPACQHLRALRIGREPGIAESTVRKHLQHVFARLNVTSRTAAVVRAFPPADDRQDV